MGPDRAGGPHAAPACWRPRPPTPARTPRCASTSTAPTSSPSSAVRATRASGGRRCGRLTVPGVSVVIRVYHVTLPTGLDVVAHRVAPGELYIVVSDQLAPGEQRAAVRTAIRAARRQAWDFGYLPLPLAAGLVAHTAVGTRVRGGARAQRDRGDHRRRHRRGGCRRGRGARHRDPGRAPAARARSAGRRRPGTRSRPRPARTRPAGHSRAAAPRRVRPAARLDAAGGHGRHPADVTPAVAAAQPQREHVAARGRRLDHEQPGDQYVAGATADDHEPVILSAVLVRRAEDVP